MIVTVTSYKGGVGKTTTAVHLAGLLAATKASTALIDGDDNRSATKWNNRGPLPYPVVDERQTARAARQYEHLVIDTSARPNLEDLKALVAGCDLLVIPSTPDAMALDALMDTVDTLQRLGSEHYRILLTAVPPKPSRDGAEARAMLEEAGLPIFRGSIRRLASFQKATLGGRLVKDVDDVRAALGWQDYVDIGKEMMNEQVFRVVGTPKNQFTARF